jgi:hypothetical protein
MLADADGGQAVPDNSLRLAQPDLLARKTEYRGWQSGGHSPTTLKAMPNARLEKPDPAG